MNEKVRLCQRQGSKGHEPPHALEISYTLCQAKNEIESNLRKFTGLVINAKKREYR